MRHSRTRAPVHRSRLLKAWVFTRHADVGSILPRPSALRERPAQGHLDASTACHAAPPEELTMLLLDPPDHTRLRVLVSKAFTPKSVNALEPPVRNMLGRLLDDIGDPTAFDLMQAVAGPCP